MTTEEWLEKEGYPITMPMTRSNLANIIDRYVMQVASKNSIKLHDIIKNEFGKWTDAKSDSLDNQLPLTNQKQ